MILASSSNANDLAIKNAQAVVDNINTIVLEAENMINKDEIAVEKIISNFQDTKPEQFASINENAIFKKEITASKNYLQSLKDIKDQSKEIENPFQQVEIMEDIISSGISNAKLLQQIKEYDTKFETMAKQIEDLQKNAVNYFIKNISVIKQDIISCNSDIRDIQKKIDFAKSDLKNKNNVLKKSSTTGGAKKFLEENIALIIEYLKELNVQLNAKKTVLDLLKKQLVDANAKAPISAKDVCLIVIGILAALASGAFTIVAALSTVTATAAFFTLLAGIAALIAGITACYSPLGELLKKIFNSCKEYIFSKISKGKK